MDCAWEEVEGGAKGGTDASSGDVVVTGTERWILAITDFGREESGGAGFPPPIWERLRLDTMRREAMGETSREAGSTFPIRAVQQHASNHVHD